MSQHDIAIASIRQLSSDQLAATMRLLLWMKNSRPGDSQVRAKMARTFDGDSDFAAAVVAFMGAVRRKGIAAANEPPSCRPPR